jgi:Fur family transcriptional regulator, iron response regulator
MASFPRVANDADAAGLLRRHGVHATLQRVLIARVLFARPTHLSAEDVYQTVHGGGHDVSKATVYNTLGLFAAKGLIREVIADPKCVFYDSNTDPHHHFYEESTGRLIDIDSHDIRVTGIPPLPEGTRMEGVDVVVRLRRKGK